MPEAPCPVATADLTGASEPAVVASAQYCAEVVRHRASSFYRGMKLTPEPKRADLYTVYAFMRACDDLADTVETTADDALQHLDTFRAQMQAACDGQPIPPGLPQHARLWPAFQHVVRTYEIDPGLLHAMFEGQKCDLTGCRYQTFEQLYQYCYRVASVVGLVCVRIWGTNGDPAALQLAEYRGVALQLTNILRDLVEDARRGRMYLPAEDLARFGVDPAAIGAAPGPPADTFEPLMDLQIQRASEYYQRSAELERHIDPSCRAASWAIMQVYRALLEKIARRPARVLTGRVRLGKLRKLGIAVRASLQNRRTRYAS